MKKLLLVLFLFVALNASAQSNTEIAVITYSPFLKELSIAINGTDYRKIDVPKATEKGNTNMNPALLEINKMAADGWELFETEIATYNGITYMFVLKRKKI